MTETILNWQKWEDVQPKPGTRVVLRGSTYNGAAHFVDDRLRRWDSTEGYGEDLAIDPHFEWRTMSEGSLPRTFSVD
jgi:hypothetical protein